MLLAGIKFNYIAFNVSGQLGANIILEIDLTHLKVMSSQPRPRTGQASKRQDSDPGLSPGVPNDLGLKASSANCNITNLLFLTSLLFQ